VEQVVICAGDAAVSDNIFREIMQNAEDILELLELPYRIMSVCSGDMSQKTYKQYDIEVQNEDGSIRIPEALRKYMNGLEKLNLEAEV